MALIEFLNARLAEDEAVARAIRGDGPGIWAVADDPHGTYMEVLGALRADAKPGDGYWHAGLVTWVLDSMTDYRGFPLDPDEIRPTYLALATHIARHDPAGVLRRVAAGRRVLARHKAAGPSRYRTTREELNCEGCGWEGEHGDPVTENIDNCPELRDLASIWADHDDYPPRWELGDRDDR